MSEQNIELPTPKIQEVVLDVQSRPIAELHEKATKSYRFLVTFICFLTYLFFSLILDFAQNNGDNFQRVLAIFLTLMIE